MSGGVWLRAAVERVHNRVAHATGWRAAATSAAAYYFKPPWLARTCKRVQESEPQKPGRDSINRRACSSSAPVSSRLRQTPLTVRTHAS